MSTAAHRHLPRPVRFAPRPCRLDNLLATGVSREALAAVHAPLGIDIGSQTVPEIAVSICAELVAHRNRGQVPGRPRNVEV